MQELNCFFKAGNFEEVERSYALYDALFRKGTMSMFSEVYVARCSRDGARGKCT